jgi:uncharacterized protein (DUF433 family)
MELDRMNGPKVVVRDRDILGGTPVFAGTRVPIRSLLDYLAAGQNLHEFLDDFPTVQHAQAVELLAWLEHIAVTRQYESAAR